MQTLIKLKISEIVYDVQNKTYLTGRSVCDGSNHAHVAYIQANDDDENAAQILRSITMAFSILRNKLGEYVEDSLNTSSNSILDGKEDLEFSLNLPSNYNVGVTATLGQAAHQFIVATAVADWFAITAKGETADYSVEAANALKVLEEALFKRSRPKRVTAS